MNKIGLILFLGSLVVLTLYILFVYIPALQTDITNSNALMNAIWVSLVCGIVMIIGVVIARQK